MNWFFGHHSNCYQIIDRYWDLKNNDTKWQFYDLFRSDKVFLSNNQLNQLHEKTFESFDLPFGKIDKFSSVGMISTEEQSNAKFIVEINKCLKIIEQIPEFKSILNKTIKLYIPLTNPPGKSLLREAGSGKSCHWLKGAVFISLPKESQFSSLELCINIAHELGHQILMLYQDADKILMDLHKPVYSAVRKTLRPAIMSFHALVAIYFMIVFIKSLLMNSLFLKSDQRNFLALRLQTLLDEFNQGVFSVKDLEFTDLGLCLLHEMLQNVK